MYMYEIKVMQTRFAITLRFFQMKVPYGTAGPERQQSVIIRNPSKTS